MTESQKRLREAARLATPGPWLARVVGENQYVSEIFEIAAQGETIAENLVANNAPFIAIANPSAILDLLEDLERAEVDAERYRWLRDKPPSTGEYSICLLTFDGYHIPVSGKLDAAIDALKGK